MKKYLNKKFIPYAILPVMAMALIGAGTASAHGLFGFGSNATPQEIATAQTDRFTQEAALLGISVDAVKSAWAEGKTLEELATANGITADQLHQKMEDARKQHMKDQLAMLVSQGVITQVQADQRSAFIDKQAASGNTGRGGMGHGGPGRPDMDM